MTHDYKRNGTTTLFAALDVLTGTVIRQCLPRHRLEEFLMFLTTIDREVPRHLQVHLILDNYSTHKHADVQGWLKRHPSVPAALHPNVIVLPEPGRALVPRPHRQEPAQRIFASVPDLIASIQTYIDASKADPKPYVWTATAESILAKVARFRNVLDQRINQD